MNFLEFKYTSTKPISSPNQGIDPHDSNNHSHRWIDVEKIDLLTKLRLYQKHNSKEGIRMD